MSTIRLSGVIRESIVDGPGIRFTVFVQGCPHHCEGCHNPETWDPAGGYDCPSERILTEFFKNPLLAGITLSGGEPFEQAEALVELADAVVTAGKNIVSYSGYTYEQLLEIAKEKPSVGRLLSLSSILVDGRFVLDQRDLTLRFAGSRNQRVIDLEATRGGNSIVLYDR